MTQPATSTQSWLRVSWRGLCTLVGVVHLSVLLVPCGADELSQASQVEDASLPLPRWSKAEIDAFRQNLPGAGGLLPAAEEAGALGESFSAPLAYGPRLEPGTAGPLGPSADILPRLREEEMNLFLPDSLLTRVDTPKLSKPAPPTALSSLKDVTPEFLASGNSAPANEYLVDPETRVTEMHAQEVSRFLDFHAQSSVIKLHVLILPKDAKLPTNANLDGICSGSLAKGSACLLVYPLGEPWRARLFLSKSVHDRASPAFLTETARACVDEALQCSEVHDQLRSYTVELSTRLFWLQKAMSGASNSTGPLAEVSAENSAASVAARPVTSSFPLLTTGMVVLGLMGAGALAKPAVRHVRSRLRQRRQNRVWMLPEVETVPRLGGAFTGGGGGMLRFTKPSA